MKLKLRLLPLAAAIAAVSFIYYKSVYQSPDQLNDFIGMILLISLLGLFFHSNSTWVDIAAPFLIAFLFFPPLYWLWRSGQYDTTAIAGLIPIQDMLQYYGDALLLQYGYRLALFSSNRPIFISFLSFILKITNNNLQLTLVVLTIFVIISVIFLAFEVKKSFGGFTAMTVVVMIYYCYKGYGFIGKIMTEQLGLPLGALALALFLHGLRKNKLPSLLLGLLTLTVALNTRAGAFFVIPAVIFWGTFFYSEKGFSFRNALAFSSAALVGFLLNFLIVKGIGNLEGVPFENFGHTFYGLIHGYRGWPALLIDHPNSRGRDAWPYILETLRSHPENLPLGIMRAYFDYLTPKTMFRFLYFSRETQTLVSSFLYGCTILGIWRLFRLSSIKSFFLFILAGIFLSIPFVPPIDDGIRALTATIPFSALLLALPLSIDKRIDDIEQFGWLHGYTLLFIFFIFTGPFLVRFNPVPKPTPDPINCPENTIPVVFWVKQGSFVRLVENESRSYSFVPDLRVRDFREATAKNPFDFLNEISPIFRRMEPNQTILAAHNLYNLSEYSKPFMLIAPTNLVKIGQINQYCAYHIVTDSYGPIDLFLEYSLDPGDFLDK